MSTNGNGKRKRAYGASCLPCREKKISCDGVRPRCGACRGGREECLIPAPARSLRRLETPSDRGQLDKVHMSPALPEEIATMPERMRRMEERIRQMEELMDFPSLTRPPSPAQAAGPSRGTPWHNAAAEEGDGARYRISVDETGNVIYHGLTSWSQGPNVAETAAPPPPIHIDRGMTDPSFAPIFQALATSKHISVAPELGDALLNTYFCYQVFNIIERSTFIRDMVLGGPLCSDFLLMTMYASATRMIDGLDEDQRKSQGELFMGLAKEYLAREMEGPNKISTVQGLLLLSGRECAIGEVAQGWNHAGLAFRMIHDLGIHLAPETVAGVSKLSREEQATRDRVFWAAFIWDKAISLALGREPTFPPRRGRDPSTMQDFDDDAEPWTAYFADPLRCPEPLIGYVYQPKRRVAAFRNMARSCLILHEIIMQLYSSESRLTGRARPKFMVSTRKRLDDLFESVPEDMKFHVARPPPPPWVFMWQMLHHASYILLHRPFLDHEDIQYATGDVAICLEHSVTANLMAVHFARTFGDRLAYVAVYASFVAASFDIVMLDSAQYDVQIAALSRLHTWLAMMEKSVVRVPSVRRSVQHVISTTYATVAKHPLLGISEPGQWIMAHHAAQSIDGTSPSVAGQGGMGAFDFFELLGGI